MKLLIINGPNLNMLGVREPDVYGTQTYEELERFIIKVCGQLGVDAEICQFNGEGDIVTKIQQAYGVFDGIIINPAAYTHTSIAILDALKAVGIRAAEVHLSDISRREEFRRVSYAGQACEKSFVGLGFEGYKLAVEFFLADRESSFKNE